MTDSLHYVYILMDPDSLAVRYVGSSSSPSRRLMQHAIDDSSCCRVWVSRLDAMGKKPIVGIIETVDTRTEAHVKEVEWTKFFFLQGAPLLNKIIRGIPLRLRERQLAQQIA